MDPFSWDLWFALVCLWFFYGVALWFISCISKKMPKNGSSSQREEDFSLLQSLRYFSLVSLQFGPDMQLCSTSGKILQSFWSFFTLILVATYTANLAAIFSQESYDKPLDRIEDIPDSNYSISAISWMEDHINNSQNPILKDLVEKNRTKFPCTNNWDRRACLKNVTSSERGIWFDYDDHLDKFIEDQDDLYKLEGLFSQSACGFVLRKNWAMASQIFHQFVHYGKFGVFNKIMRNGRKKAVANKSSAKEIDISGFATIILFMGLGGVAAMMSSLFAAWRLSVSTKIKTCDLGEN